MMVAVLNSGAQRSGKGSKISVSGTDFLAMGRWNADWKGDPLDTVNFESYNAPTDRSLDEGLIGVESSNWSFAGNYDAGVPVWIDPPGIFPRSDLPDLELITNINDSVGWTYPLARVFSAANSTEVRGLVTTEGSGMNQGTFGVPTEPA